MKHLIQLIVLGILVTMSSCGEFYTFDETDTPSPSSMRVAQDTAYLMVGDTLPLRVSFAPEQADNQQVFWVAITNDSMPCTKIVNDTLYGLQPGETDAIAVYGVDQLRDTCHVIVLNPWEQRDLNHDTPYDMPIYARITVKGQPWNPSTQTIVATVRGKYAGRAEMKEALGVSYAQFRLWSLADEDVGQVKFLCYDRQKHYLYKARQHPEFTALSALGTLSDLYAIDF